MKNSVEEANNFRDSSAALGTGAKQAKVNHAGDGVEVLSSRFTILKQVGDSPSARFYLARDNHSQPANLVFIKALHRDVVKDPTELVSFLLEARAAAKLSHDNIARARGGEQIGGTHFYIVEHIAGAETLRELLDQKGWLDIDQATRLAHELADALKCAHESGILHLEIEPNKILLDSSGKATLTGFGVDAKKQFEWAHRKRSANSSFAYLSPEQLDGSQVDQRSDLYSLGVTLYEALTDRLPVNAESASQMKQKIATQKVQPPHLLRTDVPVALSSVVTRLISKNPSERFQDAASLKSALSELLNPVSRQPAIQDRPRYEAIQDEWDYTHTRELASEPARSARASNASLLQQSPISADGGAQNNDMEREKNEVRQSASPERAAVPALAPPQSVIDKAEKKALEDERISGEHFAPEMKRLKASGSPLPMRLALLAALLVAVIAISFLVFRYRSSQRVEGAQASDQSTADTSGAEVDAKEPAPVESKQSDPNGDQASTDKQPDSTQQHPMNLDVSNTDTSSMGLGASVRSRTGSARASVRQPRKYILKNQKAARRNRARLWGRNIYKRR